VLRYRLWDLDVVIRKTVVVALVTALISAVYVAIVGGIGALVGSRLDTALAFAGAAVLAVAFQPIRRGAGHFADRLVYGKRATPYEVLSDFSGRVGGAYADDDVLPRMAEILGEGTGADAATVWLHVGRELRPAASWPRDRELPTVALDGTMVPDVGEPAFDVRHRGELLGALSMSLPANDPMDPTKERLIRDLASQAGLVLRNVRLIEELRASRQRLVAAQDEERRKIERNLHDGAQQQLVALHVQLRLMEQQVGKNTDMELQLVQRLQQAAGAALEDLRDLARGIYPPLLADQGLVAALEAQTRRSPVQVTVESDGVGRYAREVEAALYFCALEALNNVAKYAEAASVQIDLSEEDGMLHFRIRDDGRGFDTSAAVFGTGLQGMADRLDAIGGTLEVSSEPGHGTTVTGTIFASPR
jgi:signal transduction histidine kinase